MNIPKEYYNLGELLEKVKCAILFLECHAETKLEKLELQSMKSHLQEIFLSRTNAQSAYSHQEEARFLMGENGFTLALIHNIVEFSRGHYTSFHADEHEWALRGCKTCIMKHMSNQNRWKKCCPNCLIEKQYVVRNEDLI